ncbi:MAG TPA: NAD(+) synthase [Alcaligenes faecalis]|nr:NAD(+) synthase [Alcaligenes faecalis]
MSKLTQHQNAKLTYFKKLIVNGLQYFAKENGFKKVLVGCSGGIDSALTIALAAEALGPENVTAITMPSEFSSDGSITDSQALCKNLGVELLTCPIRFSVDTVRNAMGDYLQQPVTGVALENLQARMRGLMLMTYSNMNGHLLLTTGNKSEVMVGYCTLYGDTNGGLNLIGDLFKTDVFDMSTLVNDKAGKELIPQSIIDKPPSAELAPGQRDEDSLPPYPILDSILRIAHCQRDPQARGDLNAASAILAGLAPNVLSSYKEQVATLVRRSAFKRLQMAPAVALSSRDAQLFTK